MIFADLLFLFVFLPIALGFYFIFKKTSYKNIVLVIFSLLFYAWGEPFYVFVLCFSTMFDYFLGMVMHKHDNNEKIRKAAMLTSVIANLSLLGLFKYGGFIANNLNLLIGREVFNIDLPLPIGISFYTFQTLSYTIDLYKRKIKVQKNPVNFAAFVTMWPQINAGPIVRYENIHHEIDRRKITAEDVSAGLTRFCIGLAKKVIIANQVGAATATILGGSTTFSGSIADLTISGAWLGLFFFGLQAYYDFSGYSDMAIGLGRVFGFKFPENFNYPFISKSISEFWRRWHMTMGGFFRDYVYIPLGGNRVKKLRFFMNIMIVWFLTGLWHGASWNFAVWGLYFGFLMIAERAFLLKFGEKFPGFIRTFVTFTAITFSWSLFYFEDFSEMLVFLRTMFGFNGNGFYDVITMNLLYDKIFIVIIAVIFCAPVYKYIAGSARLTRLCRRYPAIGIAVPLGNAALVVLCALMLVGDSFNPFLYFRF
jgi:alginate O-acetyltransferase complex protein AlgI